MPSGAQGRHVRLSWEDTSGLGFLDGPSSSQGGVLEELALLPTFVARVPSPELNGQIGLSPLENFLIG